MRIQNVLCSDIDAIFEMYDFAVAFQKTKFYKHWQGFDRALIEKKLPKTVFLKY